MRSPKTTLEILRYLQENFEYLPHKDSFIVHGTEITFLQFLVDSKESPND